MRTPLPRVIRLGLSFTVALLAGCASMSEEECLTADWYERGAMDGRHGQSTAILDRHREACAKAGVVPDTEQFHKGHNVGIREFCRPENGTSTGHRGYRYQGICPADLHDAFVERYRAAYRVYEAKSRTDTVQRDIRIKENNLNRELRKEKDKDGKGGPDHTKLRQWKREIHDLEQSLRRARDDLYHAERLERELLMDKERHARHLQMERERHELRMQLQKERGRR